MRADPKVQARCDRLVAETKVLLDTIRALADPDVSDPLTDPATLARAVAVGMLDAPQLRNNPFALGRVETRIVDGACLAVDDAGTPRSESERLTHLLQEQVQ